MRQFQQQYEEWVRLLVDKAPLCVQTEHTHQEPGRVDGAVCMWDGTVRSGSHSAGGLVILTPDREVLMAKGVQFPWFDDPLVVKLFCGVSHSAWRILPLKGMRKLSLRKSTAGRLVIVG
ncbi:unnamed protein product [Linum trigynum]|uniref:Uncharacterized protein n=1 Tax=Linum trigynum TaxID=586398 RepID=A0AAV2CW28_9ROSI